METKWSSLVSYGLTSDALTDFLPLDVTSTSRRYVTIPSRLPSAVKRSWVRNREFH